MFKELYGTILNGNNIGAIIFYSERDINACNIFTSKMDEPPALGIAEAILRAVSCTLFCFSTVNQGKYHQF